MKEQPLYVTAIPFVDAVEAVKKQQRYIFLCRTFNRHTYHAAITLYCPYYAPRSKERCIGLCKRLQIIEKMHGSLTAVACKGTAPVLR